MSATGSVILIWGFSLFSLWFPEPVHRNRTYNVVGLLFCLEREAQSTQECAAFVVGCSGSDYGDIHAANAVDLIWIDFMEHGLFGQTERVVSEIGRASCRERGASRGGAASLAPTVTAVTR